jgi:hypothetical protein
MSHSGVIRAKHWFYLASEQLASRHPFAAGVAVSLLQDSVESLAHSAAGQIKATLPPKAAFADYWDKFPGPKTLPYRTEMMTLNVARVAYKHYGALPASEEADRMAVDAHRFLVETSKIFFDSDFDRTSEADLLANAKCREFIVSAEDHLAKAEPYEALKRCRDAMDELEKELATRVPWSSRHRASPLRLESRDAAEVFKWVQKELSEQAFAISLTSIGVLPQEFRLASMLLPTVSYSRTNYQFVNVNPNSSSVSETIRIIIRIALRVQSAGDNLQRIVKEFTKPNAQ